MSFNAVGLGPDGRIGEVEVTEQWLSTRCATPQHERVAGQTAAALGAPLGLPALARCLAPGDRVAVAVAEETPAAADLVVGAVSALIEAGVEPTRVTVATVTPSDAGRVAAALQRSGLAGVEAAAHDPDDEDQLCFAGMTRTERALLVNRQLFEADLVLPIRSRSDLTAVASGVYGGVFPDFFDRKTIDRVRRVSTVAASADAPGRESARRREADEAGWLLGVPMVIEAVAGPRGELAGVFAGTPDLVSKEVDRLDQQIWRRDPPQASDLVIACLGGMPEEQTWSALANALDAAERVLKPGGVVAVWTELDQPLGESLGRLVDVEDLGVARSGLVHDAGAEAWAAWRIARALERGPVFLRSLLPAETVESLGMAPVADAAELGRLADRQPSRVLLEEAQHARFESSPTGGET